MHAFSMRSAEWAWKRQPASAYQRLAGKLKSHDDQELSRHGHLVTRIVLSMEFRVGATRGMQAPHPINFEGPGQAPRYRPGCGMGRHRGHTRRSTTICWAGDRPNQRALVAAYRGLGPPMDLRDPSWTRAMDRDLLEACSSARRFRCALLQGTVVRRVGWQGLQQRPTLPIYRGV